MARLSNNFSNLLALLLVIPAIAIALHGDTFVGAYPMGSRMEQRSSSPAVQGARAATGTDSSIKDNYANKRDHEESHFQRREPGLGHLAEGVIGNAIASEITKFGSGGSQGFRANSQSSSFGPPQGSISGSGSGFGLATPGSPISGLPESSSLGSGPSDSGFTKRSDGPSDEEPDLQRREPWFRHLAEEALGNAIAGGVSGFASGAIGGVSQASPFGSQGSYGGFGGPGF